MALHRFDFLPLVNVTLPLGGRLHISVVLLLSSESVSHRMLMSLRRQFFVGHLYSRLVILGDRSPVFHEPVTSPIGG